MTKAAEKTLILFKIEATEGTDAAPVEATDAILTRNFSPTFLDAETKERNLDQVYFGARPSTLAKLSRRTQFEVEIAGSGTAGTIAPWQKLLRPCGFDAGTVTAGTKVTSALISSGIPSATLHDYYDNLRLKQTGSRGAVGFTFEDDEIPFWSFDFLGHPVQPLADENTASAATLTAFKDPVVASTENTVITLGAYSAPIRRVTMNSGSALEFRSLIGPVDRVLYRNRAWAGEVVMEVPDLTAKDYFANVLSRTTIAGVITHGTVAGNIVAITMPRLELGSPTFSNEQGALMASFPLKALPSTAGNDEIVIEAR